MITMTFLHNHECALKGQEHVVRPHQDNGTYVVPHIKCAETLLDLLLVGEGERV